MAAPKAPSYVLTVFFVEGKPATTSSSMPHSLLPLMILKYPSYRVPPPKFINSWTHVTTFHCGTFIKQGICHKLTSPQPLFHWFARSCMAERTKQNKLGFDHQLVNSIIWGMNKIPSNPPQHHWFPIQSTWQHDHPLCHLWCACILLICSAQSPWQFCSIKSAQ